MTGNSSGVLRALCCVATLVPVVACTPHAEPSFACGQPETHRISGGASIEVRPELAIAGDYVIRVKQLGTDVEVNEMNLPTWRDGEERVVVTVSKPGPHSLTIRSNEAPEHSGRVGVSVCKMRRDDARSTTRFEAEKIVQYAARLARSGDRQEAIEAEREFARAERVFVAGGSARDAAWMRYARGMLLYYPIEDNERAPSLLLTASRQLGAAGDAEASANALARAGGSKLTLASNLRSVAEHERVRTLFEESRAYLRSAMQQHERLQRPFDRALAQNDVGMSFQYEGRLHEAGVEYAQALDAFDALGERTHALMTRQNMAAADFEAGNFPAALRKYEELEPLARRYSGAEQLLDILRNTAVMYSVTSHPTEALMRYEEALALAPCAKSPSCVARMQSGIADVYVRVGQPQRALAFYAEARRVWQQERAGRELAAVLIAMGDAHRGLGRLREAEALHREAREAASTEREKARAQLASALDCAAAGRLDCARADLEAVLSSQLEEDHPIRTRALEERAALLASSREFEEALQLFSRASERFATVGSIGDVARVEYRAARVARDAGDRQQALARVRRAIEQIDSVRGRIATPAVRARFLADASEPHDLHVELLLQAAAPGDRRAVLEALLASDQARARFFLEASPVAGGAAANQERDRLFSQLAGLRLKQDQILERAERLPADERRLEALHLELDRTRSRLDLLEGRTPEAASASLTADVAALEAWLANLPPNARVVEYFLGERQSVAWVLDSKRVDLFRLPARAEIEEQAGRLRAALVRAPVSAGDVGWQAAAARLRAMLLDPMADRVRDADVLLVPHRRLFGIPFEVLLASQSGYQARFSYMASIQAQRLIDSRARQAAPRLLAVIADPVFSASDERIRAATAEPVHKPRSSRYRASGIAGEELSRLPGTANEAKRIAALAGLHTTTLYAGFAASRARVVSSDLGSFRMLHFATHAIADSADPQLSAIALSAFDPAGVAVDGWLRAYELRNLALRADLVVLSACDSGLGQFYTGEGFVGLTQGFIAAGARRVVASLWRVPDASTAELMTEFYRQIFEEHRDVGSALGAARTHLSSNARWQHPYFWAPFIVMGAPPL